MNAFIERTEEGGRFGIVLTDEPEQAHALLWYLPYFGFPTVATEIRRDGIAVVCELADDAVREEWAARVEDFERHVKRWLRETKPRPFSAAEFKREVILFEEAQGEGGENGLI